MKQTFLLMLAFFAFACSETTTKNTETSVPDTTIEPIDTSSAQVEQPAAEELPSTEAHHIFSDPTNPDHFKLTLHGNSLLESYAKFTITNPQGKIIYHDSLSSGDLEASMVYEMETPIATAEEREAFIRKRVKEFFAEKQFSTPAVAPNDSYDTTFGDEETWNTIKNDKNAVGFSYLIGKENGRRIAYSKLKDKVMVVGYFGG